MQVLGYESWNWELELGAGATFPGWDDLKKAYHTKGSMSDAADAPNPTKFAEPINC